MIKPLFIHEDDFFPATKGKINELVEAVNQLINDKKTPEQKQTELYTNNPIQHVHVSDGRIHTTYPIQYRCKQCGQFYK